MSLIIATMMLIGILVFIRNNHEMMGIEFASIGTLGSIFIYVMFLYHFEGISLYDSIFANLLITVLFIVIYLISGGLYLIVWGWRSYLDRPEISSQISKDFETYKLTSKNPSEEKFMKSEFFNHHPTKKKYKIADIIIWWPMLGLWEITGNLIKNVIDYIYVNVGQILISITRNSIGKIVKTGD